MKRLVLVFLLLWGMVWPLAAQAAPADPGTEVKEAIQTYFDYRYRMLSTLTYSPEFSGLLDPQMLQAAAALTEADVLRTMISYRQAQVNDLRFSRFKYGLSYTSLSVQGDQARAELSEAYELYFNCAPTVRNQAAISHTLQLCRVNGHWLIQSDAYQDAEGVKKQLVRYFVEERMSKEAAMAAVLAAADSQSAARLEQLKTLMSTAKDSGLTAVFAGKPFCYAGGTAQQIDDRNSVPVISGGRMLLPGAFFEKMGATVAWDRNTGTVRIKAPGHELRLAIGQKSFTADGTDRPLDIAARVDGDRVLLPLRAVAGALGQTAWWDDRGLVLLSNGAVPSAELIDQLAVYFGALFSRADFPRIDGSTATYPLSMEMGKKLLGLDETGVRGFITHNTTHNAYVNLINGSADLILVTQPSPAEYQLAAEQGVELEVVPVCTEGFVFLVNNANPVNGLTAAQVRDIYQGKIKSWLVAGGEDNSIVAYQREANSGSQTIMENLVMQGLEMAQPPKETIVVGMGELIDRVADYSNAKNALGYSVYYFASQMYQNRGVKFLAINGVAPDKQTIKDGTYPFTVNYYAVLRHDQPKNSNTRRLLEWFLSEEGQSAVDASGLIPIK